MTLLRIESLSKTFATVPAVDAVSLEIRAGEFFALLGASGSGKTTLLRMLAGFEEPTAGRLLLDGQDITRLPPNRRPVNLMFQSYALFPHMTVRGNVAYGLEMERLPRAEIDARVAEILSTVQLDHLASRKPDKLSGGQRQRVALARALVKRPRLLLLDEPLAALDAKLRNTMRLELKRLQAEVGVTFVVVTHDQEEALVMADRLAILRDGRLVQVGTPREVYERPASRYAADFVGTMNFWGGRATAGGLRAPDGTLLRIEGAALSEGADAVAAVRPERLRLTDTGENRLRATVRALAYHGSDLQLHAESPLGPVVAHLSAAEAEARPLAPGEPVTLSFAARDARLFPA
jgi:spermidine/putrescine ABC transporter ATP-binding subunit